MAGNDVIIRAKAGFIVVLLQCFPPAIVYAANWDLSPSIAVSEIVTDNILLASDAEQSESITQIAPDFIADMRSRRVQADIDYRLQGLFYQDDDERNEVHHQLDAFATTELVDEFFFLDFTVKNSQQILDPESVVSFSNIPVSSNRTDVTTSSISPHLRKELNENIQLLVRGTSADVDYNIENASTQDSQLQSVDVQLLSNQNQRFWWSIDYQDRTTEFDNQSENQFEQGNLSLHYNMGAKTSLSLTSGYEDNRFERLSTEQPEGSFWNAGFRWFSRPHTLLELTVGERFFGDTVELLWNRRGRYVNLEANYTEELFTDSQSQLDRTVGQNNRFSETDLSRASSSEVYLRKEARLGVRISHSKTVFDISLRGEQRDYQQTGDEENVINTTLTWNWQMKPRTSLQTRLDWREDEFRDGFREDEVSELNVLAEHQLGQRMSASLRYTYSQRKSNSSSNEYDANSISLELVRTF